MQRIGIFVDCVFGESRLLSHVHANFCNGIALSLDGTQSLPFNNSKEIEKERKKAGIITINNSKEIEREREKAGIAFATKIAPTYFVESQEQFLRLRR